jgi:hypothetical protein
VAALPPEGAVVLATTFGVWDNVGHGQQGFRHWLHPQSGLTLVRVTLDAAEHLCARGGYFVAPDELQSDDL